MSLNKIMTSFNDYYFSSNHNVLTTFKRLQPVYFDDFQKKEIKLSDIYGGIGPVKSIFKRNVHCSLPWIDTESWEACEPSIRHETVKHVSSKRIYFIKDSEPVDIDKSAQQQFNEESREEDIECIRKYTTPERWISSSERYNFGSAGLKAAKELKIIREFHGREDTLKSRPERAVDDTARNTNSGWPFFARKNSTRCLADTKNWLYNILEKPNFYSVLKNPLLEMPTALFHRVQPTIDLDNDSANIKIRQVWCVPQRIIALEYYFFCNILENVYNNNVFGSDCIYSSGLTNLQISEKIVSRLRNKLKYSDRTLYSMDYSKYDRTIPSFAIDLFFAITKQGLNLDEKENKLFDILHFYTKHTPFCYEDKFYMQARGISSGSYITNMFDSWWNLTLWYLSKAKTISDDSRLDFDFKLKDLAVCGDDCIILTDDYHVRKHIDMCRDIGMQIEVKYEWTEPDYDIFFLGRFWDTENRPIQSYLYMLTHIVVRTKWYNKDTLDFDISEELQYNRILSITLQFYNGKEFLEEAYGNYEGLLNFMKNSSGFYLLKEYPLTEGYKFINRIDAESWSKF